MAKKTGIGPRPGAPARWDPMSMDASNLRSAYAELLDVADAIASRGQAEPPTGEWDAAQVLAHVALVNAATIAATCSVASGAVSTYDNRLSQDKVTIGRMADLVGGLDGLRGRIREQAEALCALVAGLTDAELATRFPAYLVSHDRLMVADVISLGDIVTGLVSNELPGHTAQLRDLAPVPD
jgi:hypothetical protein